METLWLEVESGIDRSSIHRCTHRVKVGMGTVGGHERNQQQPIDSASWNARN